MGWTVTWLRSVGEVSASSTGRVKVNGSWERCRRIMRGKSREGVAVSSSIGEGHEVRVVGGKSQ